MISGSSSPCLVGQRREMLRNWTFGGGIFPCCPQCKLVELGTEEQRGQGQGNGHGAKDPEHKEGGGWSCKVRRLHPDVRAPLGRSWRGWERLHPGLPAVGRWVWRLGRAQALSCAPPVAISIPVVSSVGGDEDLGPFLSAHHKLPALLL